MDGENNVDFDKMSHEELEPYVRELNRYNEEQTRNVPKPKKGYEPPVHNPCPGK